MPAHPQRPRLGRPPIGVEQQIIPKRRIIAGVEGVFIDGKFAPTEPQQPDSAQPPNPKDITSVGYMMLGRNGDIVFACSMLKYIHDRIGGNVTLIVSSEYSNVASSCSWIKQHVIPVPYGNVGKAIGIARQHYSIIVRLQPWSLDAGIIQSSEFFTDDAMKCAGLLKHKSLLPTSGVFDVRSSERESALVRKYIDASKPNVLMCLSSGVSGNLACHATVRRMMVPRLEDNGVNVVNLDQIRSQSPVDMLGLYDAADAIVTIDTMHLHLAAHSQIPMFAFLVDGKWSGARPLKNPVMQVPYSRAVQLCGRMAQTIINRIEKA